ncbi:MAG: transcription antitermination factor NusB [Thermodesulfobacteriota bacterium]
MGKRRLSRELTLKFLYQYDVYIEQNKELNNFDEQLEGFFITQDVIKDIEIKDFFIILAKGVCDNRDSIDEIISKYSDNWKVSRISRIDINILRIAIYEMLNLSNIPHPVTINEAVDIAKKYGNNESGSFINGIVDRVRIALEKGEN